MMTTLSVQRMQLGDDPSDFVWIRWQWARPGARPLPFLHAFGFPLWDDPVKNQWTGPQIHMLPSQWRGNQTSPFPGLDFEGPVEMWRNGVPASARGGGDVIDQCGAQLWDTEVAVDWGFQLVNMLAKGGQDQGGSALMHAGGGFTAAGGQDQGGSAITGRGFRASGGQDQGGSALMFATSLITSSGGQDQGGEADMGGAFPPHPVFVVGLRDNVRGPFALTSVSGRATGVVGDLDLVILIQSGGTIGNPVGLSSPFVDETGTSAMQCRMYLVRPASYPSSGYQYTVPIDANSAVIARVSVRDTSDPTISTPNSGSDSSFSALGMDLTGSNNLLMLFCCNDDDTLTFTAPSGFTNCFTIRDSAQCQMWRIADQPPGATGDFSISYDSDSNWITFLLDFAPP